MADATGALLQQLLDHAAAKDRGGRHGKSVSGGGLPEDRELYVHVFQRDRVRDQRGQGLFGEIAIRGHLPVSIPNVAARGAGIERPVQVASGGTQHAQK